MRNLVLNQYQAGSGYKDRVGESYHFPNKYLNRFASLPAYFVYYEPRRGGAQVYFGCGTVRTVATDDEVVGHSYADLADYRPFKKLVSHFEGPGGKSWEPSGTMRNSVRELEQSLFARLIEAGGVSLPGADQLTLDVPSQHVRRLENELSLASLLPPSLKDDRVRRVARVYEAYERPSAVTRWVKQTRGDTCQLCGERGFLKRDGTRYCEVHHVFHLAKDPPDGCLAPEFLIVLCATCHRRMHYADVGIPLPLDGGWVISVDGVNHFFTTE